MKQLIYSVLIGTAITLWCAFVTGVIIYIGKKLCDQDIL